LGLIEEALHEGTLDLLTDTTLYAVDERGKYLQLRELFHKFNNVPYFLYAMPVAANAALFSFPGDQTIIGR